MESKVYSRLLFGFVMLCAQRLAGSHALPPFLIFLGGGGF
jgi:hypothetical protein